MKLHIALATLALFAAGSAPDRRRIVQIAHLWGGEACSDSALAVYADAVSAGHSATKNLFFDVADAAAVAGGNEETLRSIGHPAPREAWAMFRTRIPLTDEELRTIASNVAPYLRKKKSSPPLKLDSTFYLH